MTLSKQGCATTFMMAADHNHLSKNRPVCSSDGTFWIENYKTHYVNL